MINERVQLIEGASRRWCITLQTEEGAPVDLTAYELYGGAASRSRRASHAMALVSHKAEEGVLELPALPFGEWWHHQIYMRETSTGREWLLVGGRIEVLERLGEKAGAQTVAEAETHLELTLGRSGAVIGGTLMAGGPRGPMGESGHLQPVDPVTPGELTLTLTPGHIADLGTLTADTDLSALSFAESANVQTAELWLTTGSSAPAVTWPAYIVWANPAPDLVPGTAYRFALRGEPSGKLIINLAYEYTL